MPVILLLTTDDTETIEYPLLQKCIVGRSSSCDLTLEDKQLSGRHGEFDLKPNGQLFYKDLGSTNGSHINNSQIHNVQFKVNDVLRLGRTKIVVDEKRLTPKERISIGVNLEKKQDKSLTVPELKGNTSSVAKPAPDKEKKTIILNKDLKKATPKSNWMGGKKETLIEPEVSTGNTTILKLDNTKEKKKA